MSGYIKISASSEISARFESANVPVIGYGSVLNRRGRNFENNHYKRVFVRKKHTHLMESHHENKTWGNYI